MEFYWIFPVRNHEENSRDYPLWVDAIASSPKVAANLNASEVRVTFPQEEAELSGAVAEAVQIDTFDKAFGLP